MQWIRRSSFQRDFKELASTHSVVFSHVIRLAFKRPKVFSMGGFSCVILASDISFLYLYCCFHFGVLLDQ